MIAELVAPLIKEMDAADYFADFGATSQSMLKDFGDRRRLFHAYYVARDVERPQPKEDGKLRIDKGTATHTALLEPDRFDSLVVGWPPGYLSDDGGIRSKAAKDYRDEQRAAGRIILKDAQREVVRAMSESVRRVCGEWMALPCRKEQAVYWTNELTGLPMKMRLDWLLIGQQPIIFDFKTTGDASPRMFRKRVEENGYAIQHAQYVEGVEAVTGVTPLFYFVAVEDSYPFACSIHELDDNAASDARSYRNGLLTDLKACFESGDWSEVWEHKINKLSLRSFCFEGNQ